MPYEAREENVNVHSPSNANWLGAHSPVVLSRLMRRFADESLSGDLRIVSGSSIKSVRVNKGKVRFAASNLRQDGLGESMLAHEFIDEQLFELASEKMREDSCRFGEALLKLGKLTEQELHKELAVQIQRIVLSLFRVKEGLYTFDAKELSEPSELPFGLSVPPLLLKGLRRVTDESLLLEALPPAETRVRVSQSPLYAFDPKKLSGLERAVLEEAGSEGSSIGDILGASEERSAALRSCYALMTVGLLEPVPDDVAPADTGSSRRATIEEQFDRLEQATEAELLDVSEGDSEDVLKQAYEQVRARWSEIREKTDEPSLVEKLDVIEFRVAAAYSHLLAERDRETVTAALVPEPAESAPEPDPEPQPALAELPGHPVVLEEDELPDPVKRPAVAAPTDEASRKARRQQFERDARLHFQVKDWEGAMPLVRELVSLDPERARYRAMLAQAMQHHPSTRKNAEHHFLEAVRLEPRSVKLHLALAVYYKKVGQRRHAQSTFEKVLALDPKNERASHYLSTHDEQAGMKHLIKKIFS